MRHLPLVSAMLLVAACAADESADYVKTDEGKADSSAEATFMDFEFDGELLTDWAGNPEGAIRDQLLYTIGHLNGNRSVGRLDRLVLTDIQTSSVSGKTKVTYHAEMPVAWGSKTNLPSSYQFTLPKDVSWQALETFTTKYKSSCVDFSAHDVDSGSMWYYYRPKASGCSIADADVVKTTASATVSTTNTTGKFPEYHKVWEDGVFQIVAIFGKYEDGETTASDAGIAAYNRFVSSIKTTLQPHNLTTVPATIPSSPGVGTPDVTFNATLAGGKRIQVVALLVDNVRTAGTTFNNRYADLSTRADLIAYNGHAGLGENVRALARKGRFVAGQYVIVFMNGCDTYAYVDGYLAEQRAQINADDPTGTKYMEIVTNAMPAFFHEMPNATLALIRGLMKHDAPVTYENMFANVDDAQVVLVTGEEDNVFVPGGGGGGGGGEFTPMHEVTSVAQGQELRFETATAPAGTYVVKMAHDGALPGGDADLYVKVGSAPTTSSYDCRPWLDGSNEECRVTVTSPARIFINVSGYGTGENHFVLDVTKQGSTPGPVWTGIDENGTVAKNAEKRWQTPDLAAGNYRFEITGSGDADLYVRIGSAPTTSAYDCRPYRSGSNETCTVSLNTTAPIHVMVRGYASSSSFRLVGKTE